LELIKELYYDARPNKSQDQPRGYAIILPFPRGRKVACKG